MSIQLFVAAGGCTDYESLAPNLIQAAAIVQFSRVIMVPLVLSHHLLELDLETGSLSPHAGSHMVESNSNGPAPNFRQFANFPLIDPQQEEPHHSLPLQEFAANFPHRVPRQTWIPTLPATYYD